MSHRKAKYTLIVFLFLISLIFAGIIFYSQRDKITIIFLNVGQGDAVLIEQGNKQILIDGGPDGQLMLEKLGEYIPFWDRNIEIIIATHPDQDHIDGLIDVMENYKVEKIIDNGKDADSQVYKKYIATISEKNIIRLEGTRGMKINLSEKTQLNILYPEEGIETGTKDNNSQSLVTQLKINSFDFLFTGDLPDEKEEKLMKTYSDLDIEVLKVSHHGSKYATTADFLKTFKPEEAIISVGKNNRYGHPSPDILDRLHNGKINIYRTDEWGDIVYSCDVSLLGCFLQSR